MVLVTTSSDSALMMRSGAKVVLIASKSSCTAAPKYGRCPVPMSLRTTSVCAGAHCRTILAARASSALARASS